MTYHDHAAFLAEPGSRPSDQAPAGLAALRFDPSPTFSILDARYNQLERARASSEAHLARVRMQEGW